MKEDKYLIDLMKIKKWRLNLLLIINKHFNKYSKNKQYLFINEYEQQQQRRNKLISDV